MVTTTTPFSSVLQQLLASTSTKTSSKGKGKARSQPSNNFLSSPSISHDNVNKDWSESVKAFCDLVEKYKDVSDSEEGIYFYREFGC
jgi:hypothetical protein